MLGTRFARLLLALGGILAASLVLPDACSAELCVEGPLPGNPDNRLRLCSPDSSELHARVTPTGVVLSWNAPLPAERTRIGPLVWIMPDTMLPDPTGVHIEGFYTGVTDRVVEVAVAQIADTLSSGTVGTHRIRLLWSSFFEATGSGRFEGSFILGSADQGATNVGVPLRFVTDTGDTSLVGGVRIRFDSGTVLHRNAQGRFDVQSFDGYHVWRWTSNPAADPKAWGTYSRATATPHPPDDHCRVNGTCWPNATPQSATYTFIDENVFDALTYHYAVTAFDQGFRTNSGNTLGINFDSPLPARTTGLRGETQLRVEYRLAPPDEFHAVVAYPNPFRQAECDAVNDPEGTCNVHFKNLPARSLLVIYTLAGDLVREIEHDNPVTGTISWDTRNGKNNEVASGVYIYKIIDLGSGEESFGRLAVIR
jgi:hypothetical protein